MRTFDIDGLTVEYVRNRHADRNGPLEHDPLDADACARVRQAVTAWPGYAPTPLVRLTGVAASLNVRDVFYKNEAGRFGIGSFKALGGAYAVSAILAKRVEQETGKSIGAADLVNGTYKDTTGEITVTCATDGNHGRSVAWGARRFGCKCVIYIHKDVSEGRKQAIAQYGAEIVRVNGNYDDSVRQAALDAETHDRIVVSDTSYPGYTEIPADVMRGYTVLADEAIEQLGESRITHIFLQGGVGGYAAAMISRFRRAEATREARIVCVEPDAAACIARSIDAGELIAVGGDLDTIMAGLACGEVSVIAYPTLRNELDDALVVPDEAAVQWMINLADGNESDSPIVAGESAVAGMAGLALSASHPDLAAELAITADSSALIIGTEGATDPEIYTQLVGRTPESVERI